MASSANGPAGGVVDDDDDVVMVMGVGNDDGVAANGRMHTEKRHIMGIKATYFDISRWRITQF